MAKSMMAIIYNKQNDGAIVPVTLRIEWLPDGKIKPLMYWMPDNSCFEVKHIYESTHLAFLKDQGEGIRFRVRSDCELSNHASDAPEHYEKRTGQCETYLYLADNRFCAKGFIDERYYHAKKEYISVVTDIFPDGDYEIVCFGVHGQQYTVERTIAVEPRASFYAGGIGIWHKVEARLADTDEGNSRLAALYWELNKWFVANLPERIISL